MKLDIYLCLWGVKGYELEVNINNALWLELWNWYISLFRLHQRVNQPGWWFYLIYTHNTSSCSEKFKNLARKVLFLKETLDIASVFWYHRNFCLKSYKNCSHSSTSKLLVRAKQPWRHTASPRANNNIIIYMTYSFQLAHFLKGTHLRTLRWEAAKQRNTS